VSNRYGSSPGIQRLCAESNLSILYSNVTAVSSRKVRTGATGGGYTARNAGWHNVYGPFRLVDEPALVAHLAKSYSSKELGELDVLQKDGMTTFDFGEWKSTVASRKNDDGSISFITIDPTNRGFEFVVGERGGKRVLILRDGQHEYVFIEAA
jgi:hypothetical protein